MALVHLQIDRKQHAFSILDGLDAMKSENQHCDFTIKVENTEFPTHRNVLAASSGYFKAMLFHDNIENKSGKVELKEVDAESVKKCIDFIYTGKACIKAGSHEKILHAADMLQLHDLCDGIVRSLEAGLNCESFFSTKKLANTYNFKELEAKCDEFALNNLDGILASSGFKNLEKEYLVFLMKSDNERDTGAKCKMLIQWIKLDEENRKKHFVEILELLDINRIPISYRRYILENEPLVCDNLELTKFFSKSVMNSLDVKSKSFPTSDSLGKQKNAILVFDEKSISWKSYKPSTKKWTTMHKMEDTWKGRRFSAVVFNGIIYIFHGKEVFQYSRTKNVFGGWNKMADLLEDHGKRPYAAVLGDHIYVVGSTETYSAIGEKFDPMKDEWTRINNRNSTCYGFALVSCEGFLYSVGGTIQYNTRSSKEVERFDPKTNEWSLVAPMNHSRNGPASVAFNELLYVLGGGNDSVECYNPCRNTWTFVKSMQISRSYFKACVIHGKIFAVGSGVSQYNSYTIEVLDLDTDRHEEVIPLSNMTIEPRASFAINI